MYNQKLMRDVTGNNNLTNDEYKNTAFDLAIENVLNWSSAKSIPALEIPKIDEGDGRSSISKLNLF